jgi:hypothetical protein
MAVSLKENNWFFVTDQTPRPIFANFMQKNAVFQCYDKFVQKLAVVLAKMPIFLLNFLAKIFKKS